MKGLNSMEELAPPEVVRSLYFTQEEILRGIMTLHCPDGFEADLTYGNGSFWKKIPRPPICFDIDPQEDGVTVADSTSLPLGDGTLKSAVFDPPFLTYVKNGRNHKDRKVAMSARFGGYWRYEELLDHYEKTISEAKRVLMGGGHLVVKCQDIIHNHRIHCTHQKTIQLAEDAGLRLKDLFVLAARHRMPGPQKGQQRHARVFHSYFLVFIKPAERGKRKR